MITRESLQNLRRREHNARTKASQDREQVLNEANREGRENLSEEQEMNFRSLSLEVRVRDGRIQLLDELLGTL